MRGRKPKPTHLKLAAGNPGKRPLNMAEPQPKAATRVPSAPAYLSKEGKQEWRRLARILLDTHLLTEADYSTLATYCAVYSDMVRARVAIEETGHMIRSGEECKVTPWFRILCRSVEIMNKLLGEFGFSPASRVRITVPEAGDSAKDQKKNMLFGRS